MAKSKIDYEKLSNPEKIEEKQRKIKKLFKDLPAEKKQFSDGLIYQFAVTSVTLERLADEINRGDLIEDFVQGTQRLRRESPALKSYNSTIKSFATLSKALLDLLPEKEQKQAGNELMSFITKPRGAAKP
jgi:geranylgeranyl pyrophosphate synthase